MFFGFSSPSEEEDPGPVRDGGTVTVTGAQVVAGAAVVGAGMMMMSDAPEIIQSGGHTVQPSTARILNKNFNKNLHHREWGRALEALKNETGLPSKYHGLIDSLGNYLDKARNLIGNLLDYL